MVLEMEEAMRALGKTSLKELTPADLVALDSVATEVTGVKLAYNITQTPPPEKALSESNPGGS